MKIKAVADAKGEIAKTQIEIPIKGSGGSLGINAILNLTKLIEALKGLKTVDEVVHHWYVICGYAICCQQCGFITEESMDDLMHMVECLVDNELEKVNSEKR